MIIDHLRNWEQYTMTNPHLKEAFSFLKQQGIALLAPGKHFINNDMFAVVLKGELLTKEQANLEGHKKFLDLHVTLAGQDTIGLKAEHLCNELASYQEKDDVVFFTDAPETWHEIPESHFALCFPGDAHAPTIGEGKIHKVIVKVPLWKNHR